ncbi:unnamed protein product [Cylindrotheca closterium]|uniref:Cyclin-like domain-containing protein n=1 Tax=Cylindrotheca closterium TaxID=2856 RepID=A0AAD2FQV7_9STRA|nr:unnamed protein product [Cylindrotheca closterium]
MTTASANASSNASSTGVVGKRPLSTTTESRFLSLDRLKGLLKQEEAYRIESNYIPDEFPDHVVEEYATWRYTMVDWFQKIMGSFQYQPETMEVTMSILDRYVAAKPELMTHSKNYKFAALTSLYVAAKMHEQCCLTPHHVNDLSTDTHPIARIEQEELEILKAVGWRVNPPTPTAFSRELFSIISSDLIRKDEIIGIFRMQMSHMMFEEIFVTEKASMLVLAALYNAITSVRKAEKMPKYLELRLFSALGLSKNEEAEESINKLREFLLTVSLARNSEEDDEEDESGDDANRDDVDESGVKKEGSVECSSPRTTVVSTITSQI